jgi:hypothetical protein
VRGSGCIQGCSAAIAADGRGRIWSFVLKNGDGQLTCFQNPYNGSGGLYLHSFLCSRVTYITVYFSTLYSERVEIICAPLWYLFVGRCSGCCQ